METPPPQEEFVPYPRGEGVGTAENLRKAFKAYQGAMWIVLGTLFFGIGGNLITTILTKGDENAPFELFLPVLIGLVLMFIFNFAMAHRSMKLLGEIKGKSTGYVIGMSCLTSVVSPCCIGAVGAIIVQQEAVKEITKYGLKASFFGVKKSEVEAKIIELERGGF